ncbi:MAG TPA: hypothetical protein VFM66_11760 [Agromyces sp.]|nr:hypothetical protein [Agromyces sp.]
MTTRDQGNGRVAVWLGTASAVADLAAPTEAEIAAMLLVSEAVRWDGYDYGVQASDQIDDRSLADSGTAQLRGFSQFGGAVPLFYPRRADTGSILRQAFDLLKSGRTDLIFVERIGFKDWNAAAVAGDDVNVYRVMNDGFNPDTEGDGGYAYIVNMLPKGDVHPWTKVVGAVAETVTIIGAATATLAVGDVELRGATLYGDNVTARAEWVSSDDTVATVDNGVIVGVSAGTADITATFPGATDSAPITATVA